MNETISNLTQEAHIELIGASGLLDETYYASNNPETQLHDLVEDYYFFGSRKETNPSFLFDTQYYIYKNPDVAENNVLPLIHYIKSGEEEGRLPSVFVDLKFLKKQIPGEIDSTYLAYFYSNEINLGLSAHPYFDCDFYLANNPDVAESGSSPYHHFIACGAFEGRKPREDINFASYLGKNSIATNVEHPFRHFILFSEHPIAREVEDIAVIEVQSQDGDSLGDNVVPLVTGEIQSNALEIISVSQEIIDAIGKSEIFDGEYYLSLVDDIAPYKNPIEHYVAVGHAQLLDPSPFFSTKYYLSSNSDVKDNQVNSLYHYVTSGESEGRKPNPFFAPHEYLELNEDLAGIARSLLGHYCHCGIHEGRAISKNRLIAEPTAVEQPTTTMVEQITEEQLRLTFNADYYLAHNTDVREAGVDPHAHYFNAGEKEGRKPNAYFDPDFYRALNPDIRTTSSSPFDHFTTHGYFEGRQGCDPKSTLRSSAIKPMLFVGHDGVQAGSEVVLLEVVKWFYEHTSRRLKVLLLAPGPISDQYVMYADIYVLPENNVDSPEQLASFLKEDFEFVYLNTVVSGKLFNIVEQHDIKLTGSIVTHIHEMEKILAEFDDEMQLILEKTELYISASPASSKTLTEKYKIPESLVTTVPAFINPVAELDKTSQELRQQVRDQFGIAQDAFVVTGCGTLYWRKGADIFIETARCVRALTSQKIAFIWIGDGPDRDELEASLTEEDREYITFIGNHKNANELSAMADVFYMSSREDPFPLVVLEAAQHAIPAICFDEATGITEFVKYNSGTIIDKINPQEAANTVVNYLENSDLLSEHGSAAKQQLFSQYTSSIQNQKIFKAIYQNTAYKPALSVIIPYYNHELYLNERIDSIIEQTNQDWEILALDDCSTDNSTAVVDEYRSEYRLHSQLNKKNSGSPFIQWQKGIDLAQGDFIWIAEGDDTADNTFIEKLFTEFNDPMVNIVSARTEILDEHGEVQANALKPYLDQAYPNKFASSYKRDGFKEVNEQLGSMCTLVNASGLLIRKSSVNHDILRKASTFKMAGDWLIYLDCLKHGKVAHNVDTANYFRRHSASQVHKVEGTEAYFYERKHILDFVVNTFTINPKTLKRAKSVIDSEWARFKFKHPGKVLSDIVDLNEYDQHENIAQQSKHIAFYVHGMTFSQGGIERIAAQISNYISEKGMQVTIFCKKSAHSKAVYPLYDGVQVIPTFDEADFGTSIPRLRKQLLENNVDIFIPMLSEWLFEPIIEAAQGTGIPIVASEHNNPWKIEELWWSKEKREEYFSKVDHIHLLLNTYKDSLPEQMQEQITVIPNGVVLPEQVNWGEREKLIIGVGRLAPQKRFDRLIDAVSMIQDELRLREYRVEIYGEGHLMQELEEQIATEKVEDIVTLKGNTDDMESVYRKAKMYAMPSEFEGLSIALLEALSQHVPTIAYKECIGVEDVLIDGTNGYIVDSNEAFSQKILSICNDETDFSFDNIKAFNESEFFENWFEFINKLF
ncbi:glycosyltransferase [Salinivibrio kushneri]|uniref:glycosyltransferase n=1 Tax=Salinivibrio kushneri TaxID=1908198 RepID=UPI0022B4ADF6|nr:glycosyltransferase [Salinivibrio kushneri]WBA17130.1 glycosyltransferase [Salinivibrio kushneri]